MADGHAERAAAARGHARASRRAPRPRRGSAAAGRPDRVRRPLSVGALGRHAAAGQHRSCAVVSAIGPAHGRALRRARRNDPRTAEPRAPEHLAGDAHDDRVRHAQRGGGGISVGSSRGHVTKARANRGDHRCASVASARRLDPRRPALFRTGRRRPPSPARGGRRDRMTLRRTRLPDPLPMVIVGLILLLVWQLVASLYFNASVPPPFRDGAMSGADPTVPPEMRVVQMKLPLPSLVLAALVNPDNIAQLWVSGLITLRSAVLGFGVGGIVGFGLALFMAQSRVLERSLLPYAI